MDDFVKKQLKFIGFDEERHADIYLALKDINEVDFRGLTVQKIRHLVPNRPDVQMELVLHIEVLRTNSAHIETVTTASNSSTGSANLVSGSISSVVENASQTSTLTLEFNPAEIKSETITDYSSGSDIEILSSSEEESEVEPELQKPISDGDSDSSIKIDSIHRQKKRKFKRVPILNEQEPEEPIVAKKARSVSDNNGESNMTSPNDNDSRDGTGDVHTDVPIAQLPESINQPDSETSQRATGPQPSSVSENDPSNSLTSTSTSRLRRRTSMNTSFQKYFDPKYKEVEAPSIPDTSKPKKKRNPDDIPTKKLYTDVDFEFIHSLEEIIDSEEKLPTKRNYKINPAVEDDGNLLLIFYNNLGKYVQRLELEFWTWKKSFNRGTEPWWTFDLGRILYFFCPKLEVLTLRPRIEQNFQQKSKSAATANDQTNFECGFGQLPKLKELNLTSCSESVLRDLKNILIVAPDLERFQFAFDKVEDVGRVLKLIQELTKRNHLQKLEELSIVGLGDGASLRNEHFLTLARSNLPALYYLELGCGLDDVSKEAFEAVLNQFNITLEVFNCRGTFFGLDSKYFSIVVPKMDNLKYFSLGAEYEFDAGRSERNRNSTPQIRNEKGSSHPKIVDVEEKDFINFGLQMCNVYPKMETMRIGNMCVLEDLHFFNFRNLVTFRVGGPWDRMISFPSPNSRHPNYPLIEEIQIPDCLTNETLIKEIPRVFPNLKKVWMWLPSAKCLSEFFKAMINSSLRELHLKTNYCFSWTLEEMFLGKHHLGSRPMAELRKIEKLKQYKHYKEYIAFHNIDFPRDLLDEDEQGTDNPSANTTDIIPATRQTDSYLINFFNKKLKIMEIEHVGRLLKIPKGEFSFKDSRCGYHDEEIGFVKNYPLNTHGLLNGFNVSRIILGKDTSYYKVKNINVPRIVMPTAIKDRAPKFCDCGIRPCVCIARGTKDDKDKETFGRTIAKYKLKVKPAQSSFMKHCDKVKGEKK